jgi:hypothetical protein
VTGNNLIGAYAGAFEHPGVNELRDRLVEFKLLPRSANGAASATSSERFASKRTLQPAGLFPPLREAIDYLLRTGLLHRETRY